jgi:thymidylate synthase (FAD)
MKISEMKATLVDHMGSDLTVANAARVSFDKTSEWETVTWAQGILKLPDKDAKLIKYLAKHGHWSPFAHTSIQLRVKAPIFVARQLVKHQVGASWNEVSRRYVDSEPEFWFPKEWRGRPEGSIKQGSCGVVEPVDTLHPDGFSFDSYDLCEWAFRHYNNLLDQRVAPEQARMILPQNMMTEWYWTGSLMFFARVCKQRLDPHAQQETREVAELIRDCVAPLFPVSWEALMENQND